MISLRLRNQKERAVIAAAVRVLRRGGVVAIPTETTYGLACDPRNAAAVRKIFRIKGRDDQKPLQLIAGSTAQVAALATLDRYTKPLTARHWPGPLTLLLPLRKGMRLAPQVSPGRMVGIRVSSSPIASALARAFRHPLAATSANKSGSIPAFSGRGVIRAFEEGGMKPDLLLDAGALPRRAPSTVARVHPDGRIEILRRGSIRLKTPS
ncbi:MAG: hypothetical protein RL141_384 [Candidatus Parcubacteria bacterium]|jgi:L-threonylcarbamoyladenylate synthase